MEFWVAAHQKTSWKKNLDVGRSWQRKNLAEEMARNLTAGSGGPRPGLGARGVGHGQGAGGTKRGLERLLWTGWTPAGRIFIGVNF